MQSSETVSSTSAVHAALRYDPTLQGCPADAGSARLMLGYNPDGSRAACVHCCIGMLEYAVLEGGKYAASKAVQQVRRHVIRLLVDGSLVSVMPARGSAGSPLSGHWRNA